MNVLDENIRQDQTAELRQWGIHFRQIGYDLARLDTADENINLLEDELEFTDDFEAKIERDGQNLREGRVRVRKALNTRLDHKR